MFDLTQAGNRDEQRILLQGKPLSTGEPTDAEVQIQRPSLFDFAHQRREVVLRRK